MQLVGSTSWVGRSNPVLLPPAGTRPGDLWVISSASQASAMAHVDPRTTVWNVGGHHGYPDFGFSSVRVTEQTDLTTPFQFTDPGDADSVALSATYRFVGEFTGRFATVVSTTPVAPAMPYEEALFFILTAQGRRATSPAAYIHDAYSAPDGYLNLALSHWNGPGTIPQANHDAVSPWRSYTLEMKRVPGWTVGSVGVE